MIISAFNYTWFIVLAISVAYIVFVTEKYKNKTEKEKLDFLLKQSIILCVWWVLYKVALYFDKDYTIFEFWNELPLQPCNTIIWLSIIAIVKKNKAIMSYCFYAGIVFASMAIIMPSEGFFDYNFLTLRCIGYYGTHWLVIGTGVLFASLGLIKLDAKAVWKTELCYAVITVAMHFVNIIMRATVYPEASYYYTFGKEENFILEKLMELIPVPLLYLVPLFAVSIPIFFFETFAINSLGQLIRKIKADKQ